MNIVEKNILIAKWLRWKFTDQKHTAVRFMPPYSEHGNSKQYCTPIRELRFHWDSNWQWLCLIKISDKLNSDSNKIKTYDIYDVIGYLKYKYFNDNEIKTKQDLFEAIVNYIKIQNDELKNSNIND
jgi:hypothetical protein